MSLQIMNQSGWREKRRIFGAAATASHHSERGGTTV